MLQRQRGLDQPRDTRRRVEMADIRLDRSDPAKPAPRCVAGIGLGQGRHLDRVAQIGAGAVAFDVTDAVGAHLRVVEGRAHRRRLPVDRRGEVARFRGTIVVDRRALDDRMDMVAVSQRIRKPPQHDRPRARPEDRALRAVVEGMAMPVGRQDLVLAVQIPAPLRQFDRDAARQRHVAIARPQRAHREMHGDQRCGTCRLDVHARSLQVEDVAHPCAEEILVVARVAQQEQPHVPHQIGVRADVEIEIAAHAAAGIDADIAAELFGQVARILHRAPRDFEELAMLRIEDRGLFRRKAEELGVEHVEALQRRARGDVIAPPDDVGPFAGRQKRGLVMHGDRFHAVAQVGPEGRGAGRAGHMRGQPDDRDIVVRRRTRALRRFGARQPVTRNLNRPINLWACLPQCYTSARMPMTLSGKKGIRMDSSCHFHGKSGEWRRQGSGKGDTARLPTREERTIT